MSSVQSQNTARTPCLACHRANTSMKIAEEEQAVIYALTVISPTLRVGGLLVHRPRSDDPPDIALERAAGVA